jgi:tetratricopeptide (TPR) repeat protein
MILRGRITLNTKRGEGIANVQVQVPGHNPVFTVDSGYFEKELPGIKPGNNVKLSVHLTGKEVVNGHNLEVTFKDAPSTDVHIVMCKIRERTRWACLYYEIELEEHINKSYKKSLAGITRKYEKDAQKLYEEKEKLRQNYKTALNQSKKLAEQIAVIDLEKVSVLYGEAITLVKREELDKAVKVLDDKKIESEARKAREKLQDSANAFILKARIFTSKLKFDEAETYFRKAVNLDRGNFYSAYSFAGFLYNQNRFKESFPLYQRALTLANTDDKKCLTLNSLGNLYSSTTRFLEAEAAYNKALEHYRVLAEKNPNAYLPYVAMTLNNLGILYSDTSRFTDSEKAYNEALKHYRVLAEKNPNKFLPDVAMTLNNLGVLYKNTSRIAEAETVYSESLTIRRALAKKNPNAFLPDVAMTLDNRGSLYSKTTRFNDAEKDYNEALNIRRALAKKTPNAFLPDLAMTLNNLGILYSDTSRFTDAEKLHKEASENYLTLARRNPNIYLPYVGMTFYKLGLLYITEKKYLAALDSFIKAFEVRVKLVKINPPSYNLDFWNILIVLFIIFVGD